MSEYTKLCWQGFPCREEPAIDATLDYVATVYGGEILSEPENYPLGLSKHLYPQYDGELTDSERAYAEAKFGKLTSANQIPSYLSNARKIFFSQFKTSGKDYACIEQNQLYQATHPELGDLHAIGGIHGCWEQYLNHFAKIEKEVAAKPESWLFILESYSPNSQVIPNPEDIYFQNLATRLGIPIVNTIAGLDNPSVMQGMEQKGIKASLVAFALTITPEFSTAEGIRLTMQARTNANARLNLIADINKKLEYAYAKIAEPKPDYRELKRMVLGYALNLPEADQLNLANSVESSVWSTYTEVSNSVSQASTRQAIKELGKTNVLAVTGNDHVPLFKALYASPR